jgi:hypothetical protein
MQGTWALTVRSLRQDNRLIRYHLLRFAVAGFLAVLVLTMWLYGLRVESPGHDLLSMLAYGNLFAVTIVGGFLFAPTITDEKEEQTLGLLRMTRIGPSALILGKSIPKLVLISLILIVQMPLLFLTRTLGGVDWPLITNVYLLIFCQLIGVVSISMLASVVMRTSTGAVVLTGVLQFSWFVIAMVIEDALQTLVANSTLEAFFQGLSCLSPVLADGPGSANRSQRRGNIPDLCRRHADERSLLRVLLADVLVLEYRGIHTNRVRSRARVGGAFLGSPDRAGPPSSR